MRPILKLSFVAVFLAAPFSISAEESEPVPTSADEGRKPDNSAVNTRERSDVEKTPVNQNENKPDLEITRKIRKSIVGDDALSTYAHNIKIITQDGTVNLKGPVRSLVEKKTVEAKAAAIAGEGKVKSQLEVAPKDSK
jgi:hyperosmotically inducible periplasmic protein